MQSLLFPLAALTLVSTAIAQRPCGVAPTPISSYHSVPIPRSFTSILANPATVVLPFSDCSENASTTLAQAIALPFTFSYFGTQVTHASVCVNGFLELNTRATNGRIDDDNQSFPLVTSPNGTVAPFWDDLKMGPAADRSTVAYLATGSSLIVEWNNMKVSASTQGGAPGAGGSLTFQAVIAFTGTIDFRYGAFSPPIATACPPFTSDGCATATVGQSGLSATIGLEDLSGTLSIDANEFGGSNVSWPMCNYRFTPASYRPILVGAYDVAASGVGFTSIEGLSGTVALQPALGLVAGSTCPVAFDDAGSPRSPLPGSNVSRGAIVLPWTFTLFGQAVRTANQDPNGLIVLNDPEVMRLSSNGDITTATAPGLVIAGWWDDLEGTPSAFMGYRFSGVPGSRRATFEWKGFGAHSGTAGDGIVLGNTRVSFQIELSEGRDDIEFRYDQASFRSGGFSATPASTKNSNATQVTVPFAGSNYTTIPFTNLRMSVPCDCGFVRFFGQPCAGTGGFVPRLGTTGVPPQLGSSTFGLTVRDATGAAPVVLALSGTPASPGGFPLITGCSLWVGIDPVFNLLPLGVTSPGGAGEGTWSQRFAIPFDPIFVCSTLSAQVLLVDLGASAPPLAATEGSKFALSL